METKQRNRDHYGSKIKTIPRPEGALRGRAGPFPPRFSLNGEELGGRPSPISLSSPWIFALLDVDPNEFFVLESVGHAQMEEATAAVASWINENGYQVNGPMFNIYHVSPNETQNPDEYVIELCFPVE